MASTIRIKRSGVSGNPSTLASGELAYSALEDNGSNGGDRLYIGFGTETNGNAANHFVIGGKFFTDRLDHTAGTLTADSAIVVDSNSKIDILNVDNLTLDQNTLSSTNTNGNIFITPDGTGKTVISNLYVDDDQTSIFDYVTQTSLNSFDILGSDDIGVSFSVDTTGVLVYSLALEDTDVVADTYGSASEIPVITVDSKGRITGVTTESVATTLTINADTGTAGVDLLTDSVAIVGQGAISTEIVQASNEYFVIIAAADATTTTKGIASFAGANFNVTSGAVSTKDITLGTSTLTNGSTTSTLAGLQSLEVDNIRIDDSTISAINNAETNVNIVLEPKGTGTVDVSSARITSVGTPTDDFDATNKVYVDNVAQGLKARSAAWVLVDVNLNATYDPDGYEDDWATLEADANGAFPAIDDISSEDLNVDGARILVTNQENKAHNGLYVLSQVGDTNTPWILRRCGTCRTSQQVPGSFVFVKLGTTYGNTGWVVSVADVTSFEIGQDDIEWIQFSGAGTYLAGDGLTLTGNVFSANVPADGVGGLEIVSDNIQVKSTLAGNGLSYNAGIITVGGTTDRISVDSTSIDISANYVGQTSITTLGTIGTGTWQGDIINPTYGGTGVNNGSSTITVGGNVTFSGAHTFTGTLTGNTAVTFPTTGTLATLAGAEELSNKTIVNSSIGSTNPSTGAFTDLTASGDVTFTDTDDASALGTAPVVLSGGISVAKKMYIGDNIVGNGTNQLSGFVIDGGTY